MALCGNFGILLVKSSKYYPQGNGFDESTKKPMVKIIKKEIATNQIN